MAEPSPPSPVALRQARDSTIDTLCRHFASDVLDVNDFERRVDLAHRATSLAELDQLLSDLPVTTGSSVSRDAARTEARDWLRDQHFLLAVMGGFTRRGRWKVPKKMTIVALMGGAELDFREAQLQSNVTVVTILTMMGGVQITVPPGMRVEVDGVAIMGGFEQKAAPWQAPDSEAPVLRVNGVALMGGVDVRVKAPGEPTRRQLRRGW